MSIATKGLRSETLENHTRVVLINSHESIDAQYSFHHIIPTRYRCERPYFPLRNSDSIGIKRETEYLQTNDPQTKDPQTKDAHAQDLQTKQTKESKADSTTQSTTQSTTYSDTEDLQCAKKQRMQDWSISPEDAQKQLQNVWMMMKQTTLWIDFCSSLEASLRETMEIKSAVVGWDMSRVREFAAISNRSAKKGEFEVINAEEAKEYELIGFFIKNKSMELIKRIQDVHVIIPRDCSFLMSDMSEIDPLIHNRPERGYQMIVMDPPWGNKSVKRGQRYETLTMAELTEIPVPKLACKTGCLLVVWITNNKRIQDFTTQELFEIWGAKHFNTWYWLKVTSHGDLVTDLDSKHRSPFEPILLAWIGPESEIPIIARQPHVFVSVPSSHSQKPPILGFLEATFPSLPTKLEMFARNLTVGWTSWGNEVLYFQNLSWFRNHAQAADEKASVE